jgi:hypothetical protein
VIVAPREAVGVGSATAGEATDVGDGVAVGVGVGAGVIIGEGVATAGGVAAVGCCAIMGSVEPHAETRSMSTRKAIAVRAVVIVITPDQARSMQVRPL